MPRRGSSRRRSRARGPSTRVFLPVRTTRHPGHVLAASSAKAASTLLVTAARPFVAQADGRDAGVRSGSAHAGVGYPDVLRHEEAALSQRGVPDDDVVAALEALVRRAPRESPA
jgi:predicted transcriptional regulator